MKADLERWNTGGIPEISMCASRQELRYYCIIPVILEATSALCCALGDGGLVKSLSGYNF